MDASLVDHDNSELRWTLATVATLTSCAIFLAVVSVLWSTGDRFEYGREASSPSRQDDDLVRSFDLLHAIEKRRASSAASAALSGGTDQSTGTDRSAQTTAGDECADGRSLTSRENCRPRLKAPRRRTTRLKSPWCTGVLKHQPFHTCHVRPN